jgi:hypothetical protein
MVMWFDHMTPSQFFCVIPGVYVCCGHFSAQTPRHTDTETSTHTHTRTNTHALAQTTPFCCGKVSGVERPPPLFLACPFLPFLVPLVECFEVSPKRLPYLLCGYVGGDPEFAKDVLF